MLIALTVALVTTIPPSAVPATPPRRAAVEDSAFPRSAPASAERLGTETARADVAVVAQSRQAATVASSSVNGTSVTGGAAVTDQAFQNASGLILVNINTGNNVAMNASMNVNVIVNPPQ